MHCLVSRVESRAKTYDYREKYRESVEPYRHNGHRTVRRIHRRDYPVPQRADVRDLDGFRGFGREHVHSYRYKKAEEAADNSADKSDESGFHKEHGTDIT